jgi:ubiquinone/menaquinone biosynthesis C-methylase UbiE
VGKGLSSGSEEGGYASSSSDGGETLRSILLKLQGRTLDKNMTSNTTNIGYWEKVLQAPTPAYQGLFDAEHKYLLNKITPNSKVLNIGCGEGRNMKSIFEITHFVYGVDNDANAVKDTKENFKGISTVEVVQGEAVNLPFEDNTFDIITFLMILPNLDKEKEKALQEASRVVKDDGFIILSVYAETAFEDRMKMYKLVDAPIKKIDGTKVILDESFGANISEQFSLQEIESLAKSAELTISDYQKVGSIGYICTLNKPPGLT